MDSEFEKSDLRDRVIRPAAEMEKSNTPARHRPRGNALGCVALQVGVHPSVALSQWEVATLPAQTIGSTFSRVTTALADPFGWETASKGP